METQKCRQCKRELEIGRFFYGDKEHKTCFSCAQSRIVKGQKCACGKRASFNFVDEKKGVCCKSCSKPGMVNVTNKKCLKCKEKQPCFNLEGETDPLYCVKCKTPEMIDVKHQKCMKCQLKRPNFNFKGQNRGLYCATCREPTMVTIDDRTCIKCQIKLPVFNFKGHRKALYCLNCKESEMIDVKNRKCLKCQLKRPIFNFKGQDRGIYCLSCKEADMIDVVNKKCAKCNTKQPSFNFKGQSKGLYCVDCKDMQMIDVLNQKCLKCQSKLPTFNSKGQTKALYCIDCRDPEMVGLTGKNCLECKTRVSYGYPLAKKTHCSSHKLPGMISNPKSLCKKKGCKNYSEYGIKTPIHCEQHKDDNDINLVERVCVKCGKIDVVNHEGMCINFCLQEQAFRMYKKRIKVKEERTVAFLTTKFGPPVQVNKRLDIDTSCKEDQERPDTYYDLGTHTVIIEIDENQHRDRCGLGEHHRMINISGALGGKPAVFIRYNPDSYRDNCKRKVEIPIGKKEETLYRWVKHCMETKPKHHCSVIYLFYDHYKESDHKLYEIRVDQPIRVLTCEWCNAEFYIEERYNDHCASCCIDEA